jgi:hypothetical protein
MLQKIRFFDKKDPNYRYRNYCHLEDFFHALTLSLLPKIHMLFIVSKQCACSRQVHIEGHMNRFEFLLSCDNNSDNDSLGTILLYVCVLDTIYSLVSKKSAIANLRKIIVAP